MPSEELYLNNTVKHLRGEISRFNKLVKDVIERSIAAKEAMQEYQQVTQKYQKEIEMISRLKDENLSLRRDVETSKL